VTSGFQALAAAVASEGVEVIFGITGGSNDRLISELVARHGIRFVSTRHEQGAVGMADGYSRATGEVGVAVVEKGPGLTNTATAMTAARLSRSSVLLIAGDKVSGSRLGNMDIDQPPFIRATAGALQQVHGPETLAEETRLAFRHVRLGLGPMVLNVPTDVSLAEMPHGWSYEPATKRLPPQQAPTADRNRLREIAALVRESRHPVVLAGKGAVRSGARGALISLADRIGAVLVTSLHAKGWFRGHPYDLGVSGGFTPSGGRTILSEADLVLAFGASLNLYTVDHGRLYPDAMLVQIDVEPEQIGAIAPVEEAVVGDARATAEALLDELGPEGRDGWRSPELAARIAAVDPWADCDFTERPGYVNRHELVRICEELLPTERLLVVGIGHFMGMPAAHISVPTPQDQVLPWRLGAIGSGLPAAVGAAIGRPDRTVVLFEGDGSFMMTLQDLETAARFGVGLVVFIENDGGYGSERISMKKRGDDPELVNFANPDFAAVARAFGCDGHTVRGAGELREVVASLGRPTRPVLIDVMISPDESDTRMVYVRSGGPV
jgi:thiamine pyrophosphate-dependent acetolactate synthase large subunit-like protein